MSEEAVVEEKKEELDLKGVDLMEVKKPDTPEEIPGNVELVPSSGQDIMVFAKTPDEMAKAQTALISWVVRRISKAEEDLKNAEENLKAAKDAKIRTSGWKGQVTKYKKEFRYYTKVRSALEEGYFIVPDFPINIIAVRTDRIEPTDQSDHNYPESVQNESHAELPVGMGSYYDTRPERKLVERYNGTDEKGEHKYKKAYTAEGTFLRPMDFPFRMVKPHLLKDLKAVAEKKIFDAIGVLPGASQRRGKFANPDPMVIGVIENKNGKYRSKRLLFLISWWIPTGAL